jgi:hypothetical protein
VIRKRPIPQRFSRKSLVALPGLEPGLFALRGRRVNQLHHNATGAVAGKGFRFRDLSNIPHLGASWKRRSAEARQFCHPHKDPGEHRLIQPACVGVAERWMIASHQHHAVGQAMLCAMAEWVVAT